LALQDADDDYVVRGVGCGLGDCGRGISGFAVMRGGVISGPSLGAAHPGIVCGALAVIR
jgi:hypothetical protein